MTLDARLTRLERAEAERHAALDAAIERELVRVVRAWPAVEADQWAAVGEMMGVTGAELEQMYRDVRRMSDGDILAVASGDRRWSTARCGEATEPGGGLALKES